MEIIFNKTNCKILDKCNSGDIVVINDSRDFKDEPLIVSDNKTIEFTKLISLSDGIIYSVGNDREIIIVKATLTIEPIL